MMNTKLLKVAFTQVGIKEIAGDQDNPEILKYFDELGFDGAKLKDETAWCSAFMNWCAIKAGQNYSAKLNARSWLDTGFKVDNPEPGDVAVLWRESRDSWKGHVGIFINKDENHIYILGGNQANQVCLKPYPISQLLEYRRVS